MRALGTAGQCQGSPGTCLALLPLCPGHSRVLFQDRAFLLICLSPEYSLGHTLCSTILGLLAPWGIQFFPQCSEGERFLSKDFLHLWIILASVLEIRVPKSYHHSQISWGGWFGFLLPCFHPEMGSCFPGCVQAELPGITAGSGSRSSPAHTLLSSACLWQWGAPAVFSASNPTIQGRLFHGCDNALRVPFESLISELRDLHRVTSLEWLQWL